MIRTENNGNNFWGEPHLLRRSDSVLAPAVGVVWQARGGPESLSVEQKRIVYRDPSDHMSPAGSFDTVESVKDYFSRWNIPGIPAGLDQARNVLEIDATYREFLPPDHVHQIVDLALGALSQPPHDPVSTAPRR